MLAEQADFQFEIQFFSGKSNDAADVLNLNRVDDKASDSETDEDDNTQHELQVFMKEISHIIYIHDTFISAIAKSQQPDGQEIAMARGGETEFHSRVT